MGRQNAVIDASIRGNLRGMVQPDGPGRLMGGVFVIARSAVPVNLTGTTVETTLASITVPGGVMGPNGVLRLSMLWAYTNSANTKNIRLKLAGSSLFNYGVLTTNAFRMSILIHNRNNEAAQVYSNNVSDGTTANAVSVMAIDMSADQILTMTGQLALGTESLSLESYMLEVMPSD